MRSSFGTHCWKDVGVDWHPVRPYPVELIRVLLREADFHLGGRGVPENAAHGGSTLALVLDHAYVYFGSVCQREV